MGNGKSQPVGLDIEEKPFLTNNFYTIHNATFGTFPERKVTVFEGVIDSKAKHSAVDRFSKNVMVYRHPNILKYVASWNVGEKYYLATEEVQPLQHVIAKQTPLQVCIGLHSILKAINFLHEKASSSHNNICQSSIYVTPEGHWKLGGMEYLCRFNDLSARFLSESRQGRYDSGISPGEDVKVPQPHSAIDQYAFGVLVEEILTSKLDDNVPGSTEFLQIAKLQLQNREPSLRPNLNSLLKHSFFNHQFIAIHNFLTELPLKTDVDKQLFFRELTVKLSEYGEEVVAGHLGALLLSRIVLLDSTAQKFLLPQILNVKSGENSTNLFSESSYKKHIVPKLMSIFCVRDIQVRLILLTYFKSFCRMFSPAQLHSHILPELLVGIKDTNDDLVSATLRALSDLVPILGSATVIGGKRGKHFSDGRPKVHPLMKGSRRIKSVKPPEVEHTAAEEGGEMFLCERPSPDGGEAPSTQSISEDEIEQWDSWEAPINTKIEIEPLDPPFIDLLIPPQENLEISPIVEPERKITPPETTIPPVIVPEIKKRNSQPEEEDFFRDMVPVISKTQIMHIVEEKSEDLSPNKKAANHLSSLTFEPGDEECTGEGWGDGLEWADVSDLSDSESKLMTPENTAAA